jgi:hypothetical protein
MLRYSKHVLDASGRWLWPDVPAPRYAGYTAWRMVTPPVQVDGGSESWGSGERFGYAPLPDGRV